MTTNDNSNTIATAKKLIRNGRAAGKSFDDLDDEIVAALPDITTDQMAEAYRSSAADYLAEAEALERLKRDRKKALPFIPF